MTRPALHWSRLRVLADSEAPNGTTSSASAGGSRVEEPDPDIAIGRTGRGPDPVVALHGITTQHRSFNGVARHLRHPAGVVGIDLRGRGDSGKPAVVYGMEAHARDVVRVLDALGLERAVVVGHSMGGFVATQLALKAPERVAALVLIDGGNPQMTDEGTLAERAAITAGLERSFGRLEQTFPDVDAYLAYWFPEWRPSVEELPPDLADYYRYDLEPCPGGWRAKASVDGVGQDVVWNAIHGPTPDDMRAITCPVHLVRAAAGFLPGSPPLINEQTRKVMTEVLDVRRDVLLEGSDHYSVLLDDRLAAQVAGIVDDAVRAVGG